MNLWTIFGSSAKLSFGASDPEKAERFVEEMEKLPGVKLKHGTWVVPENAITVVSSLADQFDVAVTKANWVQRPAPGYLNEIEAATSWRGKSVSSPTTSSNYQKDAITFGWGGSPLLDEYRVGQNIDRRTNGTICHRTHHHRHQRCRQSPART